MVLPADETNGLEFDSVIVVEPSLIAAVGDEVAGEGPPVATTRGLRTLYVALTRPTRRLTVLHAGAAAGRTALTWVFGPPFASPDLPHPLVGVVGSGRLEIHL